MRAISIMDSGRKAQLDTLRTGRVEVFGIKGYYVPKAGLPPKHPKITFPKDKVKCFLDHLQRRAKKLPGPPEYFKPLEWPQKNLSLKFNKGSKRTTFTDEVIKIKKPIPSSAHYNPEKPKPKLLLGKSE